MYVSIKMHHMPRTISNNAVATTHVAMRVRVRMRVCVCVCVQANLSDDENDETDDVVVGEKWVNPNAKPTSSGAGNRRLSLADIEQTELASGNDLRSEMFGMSVSMHIHTHIPTDTGIRTPVDCHAHTPTPTHLHTHTHTSTRLR